MAANFDNRLSSILYLVGYQFASQVGVTVLSPVIGRFYDTVGFSSTYIIMGCIVLVFVVISMFTLVNKEENLVTTKARKVNNPIIAKPPVDSIHHFRYSKVWKHKDKWYMVVGNSTKDNIGRVILYTSSDLYKWDYVGTLATSKGELGYMWECHDLSKLGNKYVLTFSPQGIEKKDGKYPNLFQTWYIVGDYDYTKNKFEHGTFHELDNGHDFYAVQTFLDDKGRRIAIGWMDMWESEMPTKQDGWCGALTIPRELTLSSDDKVMMNPVEELKTLREECLLEEKNINVCENKNYALKINESMMEVNIEFDLSVSDANEIGVNIKGIEDDELSLNYNKNISELILDCSKCGKDKDGVRKAILSKEEKL